MPDSCQRCGRCCTSFGVCITVFDIKRITDATGLHSIDFISLIPEPPDRERTEPAILIKGKPYLLILKWIPKGRECIFHDNKRGCLIYASRPMLCRTYPFKKGQKGLDNMKSRACPCLWMPEDKSGYLSDLTTYAQELRDYKKIVDKWNKKEKTKDDFEEFLAFLRDSISKHE